MVLLKSKNPRLSIADARFEVLTGSDDEKNDLKADILEAINYPDKSWKDENIDAFSFVQSLSYWKTINLSVALLKSQNSKLDTKDAMKQAAANFSRSDQLLERIIETGN